MNFKTLNEVIELREKMQSLLTVREFIIANFYEKELKNLGNVLNRLENDILNVKLKLENLGMEF